MKLPTKRATKLALVCLISITLRGWTHSRANALAIDQQASRASQAIDSSSEPTAIRQNNASILGPSAPTELVVRHDSRRPIWSLAHMINSIKELDYRLSKGANGVEADVTFSKDGVPKYTYHGPPCDCWRHCHQQEDFNEYLNFVREVAIDSPDGVGRNLSLLFLDLKLDPLDQRAKERAGQELAKSILANLFLSTNRETPQSRSFSLILSINHVNDIDLVRNFIHHLEVSNASYLLERNIGFDVGMNDDLQLIESMWRKLPLAAARLNLWQGDGYTNCLSPFYNLERLSKALAARDNSQGYPDKVYHWTIDLHDRMRESLLMGVDAIMTNHPERLLTVLHEPEIAHDYRLATRGDDPFKKLNRRSVTGRSSETARYQRSAYSSSGGFLGNLIDVITSWLNYMREIPLLSYPTTLMSRSSAGTSAAIKRAGITTTTTTTTSKPSSSLQYITAASATVASSPAASTTNITQVKLQNQPEYKIDNLVVGSAVKETKINDEQQKNVTNSERNSTQTVSSENNSEPEYEGPKWYTSLVSNMLVSAMRVVLQP